MTQLSAPIGLFFGSTTGNTEEVAALIAAQIGYDQVQQYNIAITGVREIVNHKYLILGMPTWDFGELQEDWQEFWSELSQLDLRGHICALFGLGDQIGYGEWFVDGMGVLAEKLASRGAVIVGHWPVDGYTFEVSKALTPDRQFFVGLALDEDSQGALTQDRINAWTAQVTQEFAQY